MKMIVYFIFVCWEFCVFQLNFFLLWFLLLFIEYESQNKF